MHKIIIAAKKFATERHAAIDHRRKYTGEPYIVHPAEVAEMVTEYGGTKEMIAASWMHDTLEDTNTKYAEIAVDFGLLIASFVLWLTDEKPFGMNRAQRQALNNERLGQSPVGVKTIKLADSIKNMESIAKHDPKFAITYFDEKSYLLPHLKGGDERLYKIMRDMIRDFDNKN